MLCPASPQDHKLYVFEDALTALKGDVAPSDAKYIIKHNNNTGRWLSKFWPHWDPKEPTAFVIGSLEQPRRIEVRCRAPPLGVEKSPRVVHRVLACSRSFQVGMFSWLSSLLRMLGCSS